MLTVLTGGRARVAALTGCLAVSLTLAACTGSAGPGAAPSPSARPSPSASTSSTPAPAPTPSEQPAPVPGKDASLSGARAVPDAAVDGGALTVLTGQVPRTFDPTRAYFDSLSILDLVTRSLTQYVYDPATREVSLVPDMATDLGRPNADATRWTFTLKKGLRYEDGSPVLAADVAYAIKRSFAQRQLPGGPRYNQVYFADGSTYRGPFTDGLAYDGVSTDGRDITIAMRRPFAEMDYYASFPQFTAIPRSQDEPRTYGDHPLATGPYKFSDYEPGSSLTLVRNDEWDPATDPGRIQSVDTWRFVFDQPTGAIEHTLLGDDPAASVTVTYDDLSPATRSTLRRRAPQRVVSGPTGCTYLWAIDTRKITDPKVRRAIGLAFPYTDYWKALGETPGVTRLPGTTLLPPGTAGRVAYDTLGNHGRATETAKARRLLRKADAKRFPVRFYFATNDPESVAAKTVIAKALTRAGFRVTALPTTVADRSRDESDPKAPVNVRASGFCSDWPTGGSWFPAQFDSRLIRPGAQDDPNPSFLSERSVDTSIDRILTSVPPAGAATAWGLLDQQIESRFYPVVNLGYSGAAIARGARVGGFHLDPFHGMPTFAGMYLTKAPPAKQPSAGDSGSGG